MRKDTKEDKVNIIGVKFDKISLSSLLSLLDKMVDNCEPCFVCFCDAFQCVMDSRDSKLKSAHEKASLILPDGAGITAGGLLLGERFPDRLPGPLVMLKYCQYGVKKGRRHFFYGGAKGVAERMKEKLCEQIPGLKVVGTYCPPFRPLTVEEEVDVKERVEQSGANVLWVGIGAPKQEKWMADHLGKIHVPLMLGVGAAFDFHSGNKKRAPVWIQKIGLEWMYRMFTGGRRIFIRNAKYDPMFAWMILKQAISKRLGLDND